MHDSKISKIRVNLFKRGTQLLLVELKENFKKDLHNVKDSDY